MCVCVVGGKKNTERRYVEFGWGDAAARKKVDSMKQMAEEGRDSCHASGLFPFSSFPFVYLIGKGEQRRRRRGDRTCADRCLCSCSW